MWWQACWNIAELLMEQVASENKFCWFLEWYKIWINYCDERLAQNRLYYFEEASIAIDKVIMIEEDEYSRSYSLSSEMIDAHVMLPPENFKQPDLMEGDKGDVILLN